MRVQSMGVQIVPHLAKGELSQNSEGELNSGLLETDKHVLQELHKPIYGRAYSTRRFQSMF
jgi:hypothetical protein